VPEVNAYLKLNDTLRLFLQGDLTEHVTTGATDGELGVHLDVTLMPILRRRLREANWQRDRYLWIREPSQRTMPRGDKIPAWTASAIASQS
jgi:hypothetical protein